MAWICCSCFIYGTISSIRNDRLYVGYGTGALLMLVSNKVEKAKWLTDYIMTISMLAAMAAACVIF